MTATPVTGTAPGRGRGLWWLAPAGILASVIPVTLLLTASLDDAEFRLLYRTPKSVTTSDLLLVAVAALVLALAATLVTLQARGGGRPLLPPRGVPRTLRTSCHVLFWLTILGYVTFTVAGFARGVSPSDVANVLVSADNYGVNMRDYFGGVPGLSTLTQVGMAFVVVATYVLMRERNRWLVAQLVVVLVLTLLRSYITNERLALIEVAVPPAVVVAMAARNSRHATRRVVARLGPLALAPLLFLLFALFEYSRSWQFFESRTDKPFFEFMLTRFAGYYSTSYNNGELNLTYDNYPGRLPRDSLQALWEGPVVSQLDLYNRLSAPMPRTAQNILENYGTPEFNNPGGVTTPFVDMGPVGGFVFIAVLGAVLGWLYRSFRDGAVIGALLYPVAFTGLLDLPRYLYWTQGRVTPAVVALLCVALALARADRQVRQERPAPVRAPRVGAHAVGSVGSPR